MVSENEKYRILLVSDQEADYNLIQELLAGDDKERFDLYWETGSTEAVRHICFGDYSVALVNNQPETHAGLDLIREVKQRCPGETILLLNDLIQGGLGEDARAEGASGYLTKEKLTPSNFRVNLLDAIEKKKGWLSSPSTAY
jgi:CheY-like chemotaxis protein